MSSGVIVVLVILLFGLVSSAAYYILNKTLDSDRLEDDVDNELHGMIGSYTDIRKSLLQSTPSNYSRDEIPLTPENVILLVHGLEGEVNNGGIDQFLFNSSGDYVHETIQALEIIKANKTADILREACKRFPGENPPTNLFLRREMMLDKISPEGDRFDDLDELFYAYEDVLGKLIDQYEQGTKIL